MATQQGMQTGKPSAHSSSTLGVGAAIIVVPGTPAMEVVEANGISSKEIHEHGVVVVPLPQVRVETNDDGTIVIRYVIPPEFLPDGKLIAGAHLRGLVAQIGGEESGQRFARIVCALDGRPLKPLHVVPESERTPNGEVLIYELRGNEPIATATVQEGAQIGTQEAGSHELGGLKRTGRFVEITLKPLAKLTQNSVVLDQSGMIGTYQAAFDAGFTKFWCDGNDGRGCKHAHALELSAQRKPIASEARRYKQSNPNGGQCRNCHLKPSEHKGKEKFCPKR